MADMAKCTLIELNCAIHWTESAGGWATTCLCKRFWNYHLLLQKKYSLKIFNFVLVTVQRTVTSSTHFYDSWHDLISSIRSSRYWKLHVSQTLDLMISQLNPAHILPIISKSLLILSSHIRSGLPSSLYHPLRHDYKSLQNTDMTWNTYEYCNFMNWPCDSKEMQDFITEIAAGNYRKN